MTVCTMPGCQTTAGCKCVATMRGDKGMTPVEKLARRIWEAYSDNDEIAILAEALTAAKREGLMEAARIMETYTGFTDDERRIASATIRARITELEGGG